MDYPDAIITKSAQETKDVGEKLGSQLKREGDGKQQILCLWGELGSGKTTFVQGLARGLGITTRLLSPTFIIVRHHKIPKSEKDLYHIDLYREEGRDIDGLGFSEILSNPNSIIIIEWPQKLEKILPKNRTDIKFWVLEDETHKIQIYENN